MWIISEIFEERPHSYINSEMTLLAKAKSWYTLYTYLCVKSSKILKALCFQVSVNLAFFEEK